MRHANQDDESGSMAMTSPTNAAAVRGPTVDDLALFFCLDDIIRWPGLKGETQNPYSQSGSLLLLLLLLGGDGDTDTAEAASVIPLEFEGALGPWYYIHDDFDVQRGDEPEKQQSRAAARPLGGETAGKRGKGRERASLSPL